MAEKQRILGLDALRGLAILGMVLSGVVPYGSLPAWMYHAQLPPPEHQFTPSVSGLTWVDLVFPMFIFCLGAAIPLALNRRIEKGQSLREILIGSVGKRIFLLGSFAIIVQHIRPYSLAGHPSHLSWLYALGGFFLLFLVYTRLDRFQSLDKKVVLGLRILGWGGIVLLFSLAVFKGENSNFTLYRSDIILIVLTNMAFWGALIWLFTRQRTYLRWWMMAAVALLHFSKNADSSWMALFFGNSPIPWIFKTDYLVYLIVVFPALEVGDYLNRVMASGVESPQSELKRISEYGSVLLPIVSTLTLLVGIQGGYVTTTFTGILFLTLLSWLLIKTDSNESIYGKLNHYLLKTGFLLVILGMFAIPVSGGVNKDPVSVSYLLITGGISMHLLLLLNKIFERSRSPFGLRILISNGKNPMIAYVGIYNAILPVFALLNIKSYYDMLNQWPWIGVLKAVVITALLAWMVHGITRLQIYWRT